MAIQRAAALPAPGQEVSQARATLARRYGGSVWDGPDRRVLLVRVPREQPDPVNDVEEAVEFLRPDDVQDITHCLLIGDASVAQVYARPLQDLMREREAFDRSAAASWRERLPGGLAHVLFQSPEDPRRRWRLAVRLPLASVRELDEPILEDLAEGIGPELETPRMKQVCAVYLIASQDDVRLEADLFLQQLTATWLDEDRRRRAELAAAQRADQARRQKEDERRRVVAEMERAMARGGRTGSRAQGNAARPSERAALAAADSAGRVSVGPASRSTERMGASAGRRPLAESASTITTRPEVRHVRQQIDRLPRGPWIPEPEDGAPVGQDAAPQGVPGEGRSSGHFPRVLAGGAGQGALAPPGPPHSASEVLDRAHGDTLESPPVTPAPEIASKLDELRARVDRAVAGSPAPRSNVGRQTADGRRTPLATVRRTAESGTVPPVLPGVVPRALPGALPPALSGTPLTHQGRPGDPARLAPVRRLLEAAGFDVLEAPTTSHAIDLAGERQEGDVQRVVVRVVVRMDADVAQGLLKTARELDVDLVLCVADSIDVEAKRLLVATKIKVVAPDELAQLRW